MTMEQALDPSAIYPDRSRWDDAKLAMMAEVAPVAMIVCDRERVVRFWNRQASRLLGWAQSEVIGRELPCLGRDEVEPWWVSSGAPMPVRGIRKDGSSIDLEITAEVVERDASGAAAGVVAIVREARDERRPDGGATAAAEATEALRESEERFRMVTLATQDAIYDYNVTTGAVWRSDSFERISGAPRELYADASWWREHIHPEDVNNVTDALGGAMSSGASTWTAEYRLRRASGDYAVLVDRGVILRDASGTLVKVVGAVSDVTEQRRLEAQVQESMIRLKAAAEELEEQNRRLEGEIIERMRSEESLRARNEAIRLMSAPVVQVWDNVLALPLIGSIDDVRASRITETLLNEVVRTQARFAIMDLTGIESVDTATTKHLLDMMRAIKLLGTRGVVSGISPQIAATMTELGAETQGLVTFGTLKDALRHAIGAATRAATLAGAAPLPRPGAPGGAPAAALPGRR
ncbi:PAS domain-containing protein [Sorangium sp. So ce1335]|uniref:PAS domain-containing protein n=1 Tax=Sorangium sp. So ce1335 TaxID=3133335 RepID=UPI003F621FA9